MAEIRAGQRADGSIDDVVITAAATRLAAGGLVAFPTETVYGLGASTFDAAAIARVYALKGRPDNNPLIAHVGAGDEAMLARLAGGDDPRRGRLADRFWPGPLTLVLPRADAVPAVAAGGRDTIAVRCPRHPVATALLRAVGGPLSAPSANVSGHVSPTTAAHVAAEFARADLLILDGGPCDVGLESTVLDLTVDPPRVLRPGSVTAAELREILGEVDETPAHGQAASPGTSTRHYAPRGRVMGVGPEALAGQLAAAGDDPRVVIGRAADVSAGLAAAPHRRITLPDDAAGFGQGLYAAVREADAMAVAAGSAIILVIPPTGGSNWTSVHDRLGRMLAD